ncbi:Vacuolar protease A, partial [Blyttiomyces sp. JEL0837]
MIISRTFQYLLAFILLFTILIADAAVVQKPTKSVAAAKPTGKTSGIKNGHFGKTNGRSIKRVKKIKVTKTSTKIKPNNLQARKRQYHISKTSSTKSSVSNPQIQAGIQIPTTLVNVTLNSLENVLFHVPVGVFTTGEVAQNFNVTLGTYSVAGCFSFLRSDPCSAPDNSCNGPKWDTSGYSHGQGYTHLNTLDLYADGTNYLANVDIGNLSPEISIGAATTLGGLEPLLYNDGLLMFCAPQSPVIFSWFQSLGYTGDQNVLGLFLARNQSDEGELSVGGIDPRRVIGSFQYLQNNNNPNLNVWMATIKSPSVTVDGQNYVISAPTYTASLVVDMTLNSIILDSVLTTFIYASLNAEYDLATQLHTVDCGLRDTAGPLVLQFTDVATDNVLEFTLPAEFYIQNNPLPGNKCAILITSNGLQGTATTGLIILGIPFLTRYYTIFDYTKNEFGFALANLVKPVPPAPMNIPLSTSNGIVYQIPVSVSVPNTNGVNPQSFKLTLDNYDCGSFVASVGCKASDNSCQNPLWDLTGYTSDNTFLDTKYPILAVESRGSSYPVNLTVQTMSSQMNLESTDNSQFQVNLIGLDRTIFGDGFLSFCYNENPDSNFWFTGLGYQDSMNMFGLYLPKDYVIVGDQGELTVGGTDTTKYVAPIQWFPAIPSNGPWVTNTSALVSLLFNGQTVSTLAKTISVDNTATNIILDLVTVRTLRKSLNAVYSPATRRYTVDCSLIQSTPDMSITFAGATFTLPAEYYLVYSPVTGNCSMLITSNDPTFTNLILGIPFLKRYYSAYDFFNNRF